MDIQLKKKPWIVRRFPYILAGIAFIALAVYLSVKAFSPHLIKVSPEDHRIAEVIETPFMEYLDVEGVVQPIRTVRINALESGFVERILAEEGSMLEPGDTIVILSNVELLRTIEDEEAEWENLQRNYQEQEIEMEQRSISLRQQSLDAAHQIKSLDKSLNQSREEYRMGVKSRAELDVVEEDYDYQHKKARLQMESLRHDSVATKLKREMIHANAESSSRKLSRSKGRTENLVVRATVAGQLSYLNVTLGQQVAASTSIGEIKVLSEYKVHVSMPEYYIDRIVTGLPANIQYQGMRFPLRVSKVVPEVKDRNFTCDLLFAADMPSNIRLGKNYRVQIEMAQPEKAMVIPRGDFVQSTSGRWIYRLSPDGRSALKTEIELGRQNPQQYEIISGLKPGDKVIIDGYEQLGDHEKIRLTK